MAATSFAGVLIFLGLCDGAEVPGSLLEGAPGVESLAGRMRWWGHIRPAVCLPGHRRALGGTRQGKGCLMKGSWSDLRFEAWNRGAGHLASQFS